MIVINEQEVIQQKKFALFAKGITRLLISLRHTASFLCDHCHLFDLYVLAICKKIIVLIET